VRACGGDSVAAKITALSYPWQFKPELSTLGDVQNGAKTR
jgi:hypothetical protein